MQGSSTFQGKRVVPSRKKEARLMYGCTLQKKGGMANAGQYVPGNGRDGKCKVVTFRKREAR